MKAININQQIGTVSLGEIILALVIVAALFGVAFALISLSLERDKNQYSELRSSDRYATTERLEKSLNKPHGKQ